MLNQKTCLLAHTDTGRDSSKKKCLGSHAGFIYSEMDLSIILSRADLSLRLDDGRALSGCSLKQTIFCYINGHDKQYILIDTIVNYVLNFGLQEIVFI